MAELVSTTYSTALFEVCVEEKKVDDYLKEINFIREVIKSNDGFFELLKTPKINTNEKKNIISNVFKAELCEEIMNFLYILVDKRRITYFIDIAEEFEKKVYEFKGIVKAKVYSSMKLGKEQIQKLETRLSKKTGKVVEMNNIVDKSVIGGIMIKFNDVVIDGTIKGKLNDLEKYLDKIIV